MHGRPSRIVPWERARDIFSPGVALSYRLGRWLRTPENLDRTAGLGAEAAELLRAQ